MAEKEDIDLQARYTHVIPTLKCFCTYFTQLTVSMLRV
jgi:hypothetical protein